MFLSNLPASLNINSTSGVVTLSRATLAADAAIADTYWQNILNWNSVIITYKDSGTTEILKTMKFKYGVDTATIGLSAKAPSETLSIYKIVITNFDGGTFSVTSIANLSPYNITVPLPGISVVYYNVSASGTSSTTIINSLGYAFAWGINDGTTNCLGDNTLINRSSPVSVVGGRRFISVVNTGTLQYGGNSTFALDTNSYAWAWGLNGNGILGDNTSFNRSSPVSVVGGKQWRDLIPSDYWGILAIDNFSYGWGWGANTYGGLGDGTQTPKLSPVSMIGGRQWQKLFSIGNNFSCGIDNLSYAYAWGIGGGGNIGDNTTINRSSPTSVVGGRQFRSMISTYPYTITLDSLSYAYAWGTNSTGQLGDNTIQARSSPVSVVGGKQFLRLITPTSDFTTTKAILALDGLSYAWAWGHNASGQLGDNTTTNRSSPVSVVGGKQWRSVVCGNTFTIALDSLSYAYAWGSNGNGQLGDNTIANRSSPTSVVGGKQFTSIYTHTDQLTVHAVDGSGFIWAWGTDTAGMLGNNTNSTNRSSPVSVVGAQQLA
jgi:alpha-tubulin suppressor-like RCC1 family protein